MSNHFAVRGTANSYFLSFQYALVVYEFHKHLLGRQLSEIAKQTFDVPLTGDDQPVLETRTVGAFPEILVLVRRRSAAKSNHLHRLYGNLLSPFFGLQVTPGFLVLLNTIEEDGAAADNFLLGSSSAQLPRFVPLPTAAALPETLPNDNELISVTFQAVYALQCLAAAGAQMDSVATATVALLQFEQPLAMRFHLPGALTFELNTRYMFKFVDVDSAKPATRPLRGQLAAHTRAFLDAMYGQDAAQQNDMTQGELFRWFAANYTGNDGGGSGSSSEQTATDYVFPGVTVNLPITGGGWDARQYSAFNASFALDTNKPSRNQLRSMLQEYSILQDIIADLRESGEQQSDEFAQLQAEASELSKRIAELSTAPQ